MHQAHKARVQAQFGASAQAYVESAGHAAGPDLDLLVRWGRARAPRRVLDVATGGGHTAGAFAAFAPVVVATDLTLPMLQAARGLARRRQAPVRFLAADVEALPFADERFDVVTCRIAAHHFPAMVPALGQMARVLRPGGALLLQDILGHEDPDCAAFILEVERRRDPSHVRSVSRAEWGALLRAVGLTVVEEAVVDKVRLWDDWTGRTGMTPRARADLERFVREAPAACRQAFRFELADDGRVRAFTDRMLLVRADKA
jgi:SAM-dependent methyltransferase